MKLTEKELEVLANRKGSAIESKELEQILPIPKGTWDGWRSNDRVDSDDKRRIVISDKTLKTAKEWYSVNRSSGRKKKAVAELDTPTELRRVAKLLTTIADKIELRESALKDLKRVL